MPYTIVGMFPTNEAADQASDRLDNAGFEKEDYKVSRYSTTGNYDPEFGYDYEEDEKTSGFWNWLFSDDDTTKNKYSYAATKSNLVTVYTDDAERAEKARDIMNEQGALDVNDFTKDRYSGESDSANHLSSDERARIINKAKNNLYMTDDNRNYSFRNRGMSNDMDSLGSRDTF
ncbi:hypothetical protein [Chryseobacterium sp. HSC-36S06]|uniref:hypothetical protein n=1 Tax=Chryseobacterium sp. HSC-36S06 TaxID=2910970 RepID=UPI00209D9C3D|nr:hypothetical protein [Chryseobacterium sp. HSC-36S06]MCP2038127.1 hypothetical protein [Chryseobacterium sp. HSC-36S06]